jgi:hypothetical protein
MTPTVSIQPPSQSFEPSALSAGDQPYAHPLTDRRRASRVAKKFVTQMTPWSPGHASVPFEVVLTDVSATGAGIVHDRPLEIGVRHLLTVPRGENERPITLEFTVARCEDRGNGQYVIGLERGDAQRTPPPEEPIAPRRVASSRLKMLFLAFGIVGLLVAVFIPL